MSIKLTSPRAVSQYLQAKDMTPLKRFGQNFLCDENILRKISQAACPEDALVLEIGMGLGALTRELGARARKVVTIEIDRGLVQAQTEDLGLPANVVLIEGDFLQLNLRALWEEHFDAKPFYVCGNLPYYITGRILLSLLEVDLPIRMVTAMVQKEVAQRLTARAGSSDYSGLTALSGFFSLPQILFSVSRRCFYPSPDVDSAVIQMKLDGTAEIPFASYRRIVNMSFAMRRKTLVNNLRKVFGEDEVRRALADCGIAADARAQDVSPQQFICLTRTLESAQEK